MFKVDELCDALSKEIIGQPRAVESVVKAVTLAALGISDPGRPLGTFLFLGPTGTGKSQVGRSLAKIIHGSEREALVINCTEFKNPHDVAKLTGAPPGYIGHDEPPFLTPEKLEKKFTVVIFEEVEKADRALFDLLLEILDRGQLRTGRGIELNFTRCLIFMTSNIGAKEIDSIAKASSIGFQPPPSQFQGKIMDESDERIQAACMKAVEDFFSPEFINRIDEIVAFNRLRYEHLLAILNKFLLDTRARFALAGIATTIDDSAKNFLIEKGCNARYGARPLKRAIREYLEFPLACLVADRGRWQNQVIHITAGDSRLSFSYETVRQGAVIM